MPRQRRPPGVEQRGRVGAEQRPDLDAARRERVGEPEPPGAVADAGAGGGRVACAAAAGGREHPLGHVLALALGGSPAATHRELLHRSAGPSRIVSFAWCGLHFRSPTSTPVRAPRLDDRRELLLGEVEAADVVGKLAQLQVVHRAKGLHDARVRPGAGAAQALRMISTASGLESIST